MVDLADSGRLIAEIGCSTIGNDELLRRLSAAPAPRTLPVVLAARVPSCLTVDMTLSAVRVTWNCFSGGGGPARSDLACR
ncbi:MAG: hypothetical protein ACI89G_003045 [Minisyncoccia bacterium]|jgi:hypothetical protein